MLIVQCLLGAIAVILVAAFFIIQDNIVTLAKNQQLVTLELLKYLKQVYGEAYDGEITHAHRDLARFLKMVENGEIPNLRNDSWYPKRADFARWEHAAIMTDVDAVRAKARRGEDDELES